MQIDFSFIPSYQCNLQCWFCMYECSPTNKNTLDYERTKIFVETIDWNIINSVGFYGGEISINYPLYQKFIDLIPNYIPCFTITNGHWSTDKTKTTEFIDFVIKNKLKTKISSTKEHKKFQNLDVLKKLENLKEWNLKDFSKENFKIFIKRNDDSEGKLLPMGRLKHLPNECSFKCKTRTEPYRLALEPSGDIMFQSCDGKYPIIGNYHNSFYEIISKIKNIECRKP